MKILDRRVLAAGVIAASLAGTAGAGGGDNGMNPFYGDSWAALEGHGANLGSPTQTMPAADVAHSHASMQGLNVWEDRMNHAQSTMSDRWNHAAATLSGGVASPPPAPATRPSVGTQVDPFADHGGE